MTGLIPLLIISTSLAAALYLVVTDLSDILFHKIKENEKQKVIKQKEEEEYVPPPEWYGRDNT